MALLLESNVEFKALIMTITANLMSIIDSLGLAE